MTRRIARSASASTPSVTEPPGSVNRMALSTRLVTSCRSRDGSPATVAGFPTSAASRMPRSSARGSNISATSPADAGQIDRLPPDVDLAGIGPCQQQQAVDEGRQPLALLAERREDVPVFLRVRGFWRATSTAARMAASGLLSSCEASAVKRMTWA